MNHLCERVLLRTPGVLITCCITVIKCLAEKRQGLFQLMIPEGFIFAARKTWQISSDHSRTMLQRLFTLQQCRKPRAGQKPGARPELPMGLLPSARPHFQRDPQIALPPEDQKVGSWGTFQKQNSILPHGREPGRSSWEAFCDHQ